MLPFIRLRWQSGRVVDGNNLSRMLCLQHNVISLSCQCIKCTTDNFSRDTDIVHMNIEIFICHSENGTYYLGILFVI